MINKNVKKKIRIKKRNGASYKNKETKRKDVIEMLQKKKVDFQTVKRMLKRRNENKRKKTLIFIFSFHCIFLFFLLFIR